MVMNVVGNGVTLVNGGRFWSVIYIIYIDICYSWNVIFYVKHKNYGLNKLPA